MTVGDLRDLLVTTYPDDGIEIFMRVEGNVIKVSSAFYVKKSTDESTPEGLYLNEGEIIN